MGIILENQGKLSSDMIEIQAVNGSNLSEATSFLLEHENFALFLLGNLETYGYQKTSAPYSGNFKCIRKDGKIVGVFCLTRIGNLLVQSSHDCFEKIVQACREEQVPIRGLLGEWNFCEKLWSYLKEKGVIRKGKTVSKQILYALGLEGTIEGNRQVRLLELKDYDQWKQMQLDFLKEQGLPQLMSGELLHGQFLEKMEKKISWGYFLGEELVAMAELNAKAKDLGQVGGVYTKPVHRKKGYAQAVMQQLMYDSRQHHHIRKLIIFTGETNEGARKLYEALGVRPQGSYALLFGE